MSFVTLIPLSFWVILALLIVAYVAFGVWGIIGVVVLGLLLS